MMYCPKMDGQTHEEAEKMILENVEKLKKGEFSDQLFEAIKMNSLDRLLGIVWGLLETSVIILIAVYLIYSFKFKAGMSFLDDSVVAKYARDFLEGFNMGSFDLDKVKDLPGVIKKNV